MIAKHKKYSKYVRLPGEPKTILQKMALPSRLFGSWLKIYTTFALVQVDDWNVLQLSFVTIQTPDYDPGAVSENYENLYKTLEAVRINGKKPPVESITPSEIEEALDLSLEENDEAVDVSKKLRLNNNGGNITTDSITDRTADRTNGAGNSKRGSVNGEKASKDDSEKASLEKPTYHLNQSFTLDGKLQIPVPDGYKYELNGTGENDQWNYIIRKDVPTSRNHIDAKPLSFGISAPVSLEEATFSADRIDNYLCLHENYFHDTPLYQICSEHCAFTYKAARSESDRTFNEMDGFILAGENAYVYHVFANHDSDISHLDGVRTWFWEVARKWMLQFRYEGDESSGGKFFTAFSPNEELYPHYLSKKSGNSAWNSSGVKVVRIINQNGTDYQFIPLSKMAGGNGDDYSDFLYQVEDENVRERFRRIAAKDKGKYDLDDKAKQLQKLFHVNQAAFDPKNDRESALGQGHLQSAYLMSALRSFAWTLADYCALHDCSPEDIDYSVAAGIVKHIRSLDWLNYDEQPYCTGLCACPDLHVYYVPDGTSQKDKKSLLPDAVQSLDELRKDLEYLYPAILLLWNKLLKKRNYDKPLTGDEADVVYAWCALALAAKEPFYVEDGPMNCEYDYPETADLPSKPFGSTKKAAKTPAKTAEDTFVKTSSKTQTKPAAKTTVPAKMKTIQTADGEIEYDPEEFTITEKGVLKKYTGKNAVVVIPDGVKVIGVGKLHGVGAFEETEITAVTIPNSVTKINDHAFKCCENLESVAIPDSVEDIGWGAFAECSRLERINIPAKTEIYEDFVDNCSSLRQIEIDADNPIYCCEDGVIYNKTKFRIVCYLCGKESASFRIPDSVEEIIDANRFSGNKHLQRFEISEGHKHFSVIDGVLFNKDATRLIRCPAGYQSPVYKMPESVTTVGSFAFAGCENIKQVAVSPRATAIKACAFQNCKCLEIVSIPDTIKDIGEYAFYQSAIKSIIIPDGVTEIEYRTFGCCEKLTNVEIPRSVKSIKWEAFLCADKVVVHCPANSYAEKYCKERDIPFDNQMTNTQRAAREKTTAEFPGTSNAIKELSEQPAQTRKANEDMNDEQGVPARTEKREALSESPQVTATEAIPTPPPTPAQTLTPTPTPAAVSVPAPSPTSTPAQNADLARKAERDRLTAEKNFLEQELSALGFFKFSRKNEIRSRLAEIEALLRGL